MTTGLGFGKRRLIQEIIKQTWGIEDPEKLQFTYNQLLYIIQEMLTNEGRQYFEKSTENYGYNIFHEFVKLLLYRNLANYDSMVLITSEKGTGKSSAAIMIGKEWCKLIGIKFDPKRHIAYNNEDLMNKIETLNKFEILIADEAVRFCCLHPDTLIKTETGYEKISDLVNKKNFKLYSFNKDTKEEELQIAEKCISTKIDDVYEIETEDGKKIRATKEHKFLTTDGWKELKELKEGDDIIGI